MFLQEITMPLALALSVMTVAAGSFYLSARATSTGTFYGGLSSSGAEPSLWTLTLSQVTTWIFARSLLNAAILGYYYGIWGTIAYATYYLSFWIGGYIVDRVRFVHGYDSIQHFLQDRFGYWGTQCYNLLVGIRLISEVFANLLVVGLLFGTAGTYAYGASIVLIALVALAYSMLGGLNASLKTDRFQMLVFIGLLVAMVIAGATSGQLAFDDLLFKPWQITDPGPVLMAVALLQIWSYPMHDPVMMDRGFIASREVTRKSFFYAGWIGIACITIFGSFGVFAGAHAGAGDGMTDVLANLLGVPMLFLFNAALIISAMSTLDSTLSSAAKLIVMDMRTLAPTLLNGRLTMVVFMLLGLLLVFVGSKDLFSAVAVSGTASMCLVPVVLFSITWGRTDIPSASYIASFVLALAGALLYFTESSGHSALLGDAHKYTKLLYICLFLLVSCNLAFLLGMLTGRTPARANP